MLQLLIGLLGKLDLWLLHAALVLQLFSFCFSALGDQGPEKTQEGLILNLFRAPRGALLRWEVVIPSL